MNHFRVLFIVALITLFALTAVVPVFADGEDEDPLNPHPIGGGNGVAQPGDFVQQLVDWLVSTLPIHLAR